MVLRVVVTGLGAVTPLGNTIDAYWNGLVNGISGAAPITKFDAGKFKTQFACEVKDFDAYCMLTERNSAKWIYLLIMPLLHRSKV